ncbi:CBS domain-containing protein [Blastococcus sp. TML/C7B]|uniref:CBS domain-containing protein n=1 Tax=Blastococcus sp. TML/C7B TaxID=2798728 RepID=UPI00190D5BA5|nr:CBS domain-containing protein [Blastococcus sp. TML/C7B]MBN1097391.1 CBS domain-containing protein [Blastococcus sp. TML/C7B]
MTPTPDPVVRDVMRSAMTTVERTAHVAAAAYLMKRSHDNVLVVLTDGASRVPATLVCDGDVTQAVADGRDLEQTRLVDLELPEMVGLAPDTPVPEAAERMLRVSAAYAPVVEDGVLVGLVDLAALCRGLLAGRRQDRLAEAVP